MLFLTCLLNSVVRFVTKDGHNDYLSVESFLLTSLSEFCFSNFLDSGLRFFEEYNACYHFIHQQCFLLVTKDGHNLYVGVGSFVEINFAVCSGHFHHFWFAKIWSVWCFFHFFSSSVLSVGHQRWSQWLSFSRKFFYWHLCQSLL